MKIISTTITIEGNFWKKDYEFCDELSYSATTDDDDLQQTLLKLRGEVSQILPSNLKEAYKQRDELREKTQSLEEQVIAARYEWAQIKAFLATEGINCEKDTPIFSNYLLLHEKQAEVVKIEYEDDNDDDDPADCSANSAGFIQVHKNERKNC